MKIFYHFLVTVIFLVLACIAVIYDRNGLVASFLISSVGLILGYWFGKDH